MRNFPFRNAHKWALLLGNASMEKRDHALIINTYINAYHDKTHGPLTRALFQASMEQRDHASHLFGDIMVR